MEILDHLLSSEPAPSPGSAEEWARRHRDRSWRGPDAAIAGGFASDRPAWAFASGYHAALDALLPTANRLCALCVTEAGGNHPRAIAAEVRDGRLVGEKRFVFLGPLAERLFVLARSGGEFNGRPLLRVYPVEASAAGVTVEAGPPAPVVPEVPHGRLVLDTPAPEPLGGDGWSRHVRPFRTVEDVHVALALLGWAVRCGHQGGVGPERVEGLLPVMLALRGLAGADPASPAVHRALAPALDTAWGLLDAFPWDAQAAALWAPGRGGTRAGRGTLAGDAGAPRAGGGRPGVAGGAPGPGAGAGHGVGAAGRLPVGRPGGGPVGPGRRAATHRGRGPEQAAGQRAPGVSRGGGGPGGGAV